MVWDSVWKTGDMQSIRIVTKATKVFLTEEHHQAVSHIIIIIIIIGDSIIIIIKYKWLIHEDGAIGKVGNNWCYLFSNPIEFLV